MIKKALEYLMSFREVERFNYDGIEYVNKPAYPLNPAEPKFIIGVKSLKSIVDLIDAEMHHKRLCGEDENGLKIIIQIEKPDAISVYSSLGENMNRITLYEAHPDIPRMDFGKYYDLEAMNIALKSRFIENEDREKAIKILGNVREEAIKTSSDDGFSQTVVAKTGIATVSNVSVPSIVKLKPYRTFIEVDQPESEFLLRMAQGPQAALFEADGGAWQIKARKNIAKYLEAELPYEVQEGTVVIAE